MPTNLVFQAGSNARETMKPTLKIIKLCPILCIKHILTSHRHISEPANSTKSEKKRKQKNPVWIRHAVNLLLKHIAVPH